MMLVILQASEFKRRGGYRGFRPNPPGGFSKIFDYKPRRRNPDYDQKFDYSYELSEPEETDQPKEYPEINEVLNDLQGEKRIKQE